MTRIFLFLLLFSCTEKETQLAKTPSVYLPPNFFADKIDPCLSSRPQTLIQNNCKLEVFEKSLTPPIKWSELFFEAILNQNEKITGFLLQKREKLLQELFIPLNPLKMKMIDSFLKDRKLSATEMVQTDDGMGFPLFYLSQNPFHHYNFSDQELFREITNFIVKETRDPFLWEYKNSKEKNLLHLCAESNNDYLVDFILIDYSHLLQKRDGNGRTPFQLTILKNSIHTFKAFQEKLKTEDFLFKDHFGENAFDLMIRLNRKEIFIHSLKLFDDPSLFKNHPDLLLLASRYGHIRIAFELIKKGYDPKRRDPWGRDALYFAEQGAQQYNHREKEYKNLLKLFELLEQRDHDTLSDDELNALLRE